MTDAAKHAIEIYRSKGHSAKTMRQACFFASKKYDVDYYVIVEEVLCLASEINAKAKAWEVAYPIVRYFADNARSGHCEPQWDADVYVPVSLTWDAEDAMLTLHGKPIPKRF
jgi:hypothetical protein